MILIRLGSALFSLLVLAAPLLAQAPALPPEKHPSLLFGAADLPVLKERIRRQPYATWWTTVLTRAQNAPSSFAEERSKVRFAKSLAFAYLMTDSVHFAQRALALLQQVKFPPRGGDLGEPHNEGEVVAQYAVAYDMVHAYAAASDPAALEEVRTILAEEGARLQQGIVVQELKVGFITLKIRLHETPHIDNWHLRAYGGLGLAALALSGHAGSDGRTPQQWSDRAYQMVKGTLDFQIEEVDGGYAEGPFYSRYAADVYLPYLIALKRLQGVDLLADPRVQKMHDWSVNIRLPSGRRPNIEDGHLDDFYGHYLAALDADGGVHRWDWENNEAGLYVREFSEMDAIALYDDGVAARTPERGPTIFMPGAGDAVFRSDWSGAATYLLLRGENGAVRARGLAHEHPDETSLLLYAGGEMLVVDAGYINFENHNKVNEGRNHSLVLVDGKGPPVERLLGEPVAVGNDAFLEDYYVHAAGDYAEVRAGYGGASLRRRVLFAGRQYFVVADEMRAPQVHAYEWRLHGNGGGTSGGTYFRQGGLARWTRPGAELVAFMPEREGRLFAEVDTLHSFDYLQELTHTVLQARQSGADAEFLAVLYPRSTGAGVPLLEGVSAQGGEALRVAAAGREERAWVLHAGADSAVFTGPGGRVEGDARFGFLSYEGEVLRHFSSQDGTFLRAGGQVVFTASDSVDLALELGAERWSGFVRGPLSGYSLALPLTGEVASLRFAGTGVDTARAGGALVLALAGEGALEIALKPGPEGLAADFDGDGVVGLGDFFLFADRFGRADARFDLDGDGVVGLGDFFLFADQFGRRVGG